MKILMLVNWKIKYCERIPIDRQPPDYYIQGEKYWFFRYFHENVEVDVIDVSSFTWWENIEKNKIRFYILQTLKAIPKLGSYDFVISHGMQSGVVLSLWRRFFKTKAKHIVFDIGSFNSASERGCALKLMQFASKSINNIIYHTSTQITYYQKFFPWIVEKSKFVKFGTDIAFFNPNDVEASEDQKKYIICVGYAKRDWDTLVAAYQGLNTEISLRLIGHVEDKFKGQKGIEQMPFVPIKELISQIYNAIFCVLPLEKFNYSYGQMTLMQQMAMGKCVIAARVPSLTDYIEDGKTAILYEPKNIDDLSDKMKQCLDNEQNINRIGRNARDYLQMYCNEETMAAEVEEYLLKLL
ncbi:MAG: glycosyltransferase family 4 protein [Lachnospiraceae bacterium]|nr:glycosyltransferase family 4 protein [Lachnospiraceae bacterium]